MIKKYLTDINNEKYIEESIIKENNYKTKNIIEIYPDNEITEFYGFGSAITESSGFNYQKLNDKSKQTFIKDYYSIDGLNFHYGRISIGSNDFCLKSFSYTKKRDLSDFSIQHDKEYVIPFLKDILNTKKISLIASPWSPPRIFKRLPILCWGIKLSKKYYDSYGDYLVKFINEYEKEYIKIDYLTMQNEPMARQRWESCKFTINNQKEFIYQHLLDKLKNIKLLLWDHNKEDLSSIVNNLYRKDKRIGGIAFHYYTGNCFDEIKCLREKYPDLLLINTEMCCSYSPYNEIEWISSAEYYLKDIIGDMNSGVNAYLDWNILLDEKGGPTYKRNYVKSPSIRVNDNYIKSPIYYYLYHISHFIDKSIIIESKSNTSLKVISFKNDKKIVVVIMNNSNQNIEYNLLFKKKNIFDTINKHSVITYEIN